MSIISPEEWKEVQKQIQEGKIKDTRKQDNEDYEKLLEDKVRKVLSDPDILKKIMQD